MSYLHTLTQQYPMSETHIRSEHANTSFPMPFKAPEPYVWVFPAPTPVHDPIVQIARELPPVLTSKGHYEQAWEVVPRFSEYTDAEGVAHTVAEQEAAAIEADRKSKVPQVITIRQARLALLAAGLLDNVDAAVAAGDRTAQIEWEYVTELRRDWSTLVRLASALGLTDLQVDDLFVIASGL